MENFKEYFSDKPEYELLTSNNDLRIYGSDYLDVKILDTELGQRVRIENVEVSNHVIAYFYAPENKQDLFKLLDYFLLQKPL